MNSTESAKDHLDLVLTDQLKKRVTEELKELFVDIWGDIKSSSEFVQKLDDYEVARGHYITKEGISVDPHKKTAAIADMSSRTSVKQVQSFVQTCSWYRRYIPNFLKLQKSLTDLTKKMQCGSGALNKKKLSETKIKTSVSSRP
ncbi:hypothetical protein TNCV_1150821 [Trichonephila clavipes]|nr:hypothetical protein TNCV_1150821 [Trichonephila clavipes]